MARKKSNRIWIILGLLLVVAALAAFAYYKSSSAPKGIEVDLSQTETKTIKESVSASGRIYPEVEVIISSDVSGEIVNLYVEEGDSVVAGQLLLKIDPEAYLSSVERGEADMNNAKAQLAMSRAQIETNNAQLEELKTTLKQAQRNHKRNQELFKQEVISQSEFDQTLAQVESAQASIRSSEANIRGAKESAQGAQYSVKSAEAVLKELRTNLSRTSIKAPSSGIVTSLSIEKGERVVGTAQMAGTEIMRISDLNTMEVQVEVSENDILKVELNDEVEIEVDAYIEKMFKGKVTEIANSATNIAGTTSATASLNTDQVTNFIVKIRISADSYQEIIQSGKKYAFRPGMSASVSIITDIKEDILAIPIQSVAVRVLDEDAEIEEYEEVVFLYEADTARMVSVTTGIQDDDFIHIKDGLDEGVTLVSGPYSALSKELENGSEIREKEEDDKDKKRGKS